jgi:3',5'-nucleoside bisphosphate phosphatase
MSKKIDLHLHTIYSDGEKTPDEILELIKTNNIDIFSITDHDNFLGNIELLKTFSDENITFINGIEMTAFIEKGQLHILGYDFDIDDLELMLATKKMYESARKKFKLMVEVLEEDYGFILPKKEIEDLMKKPGDVGRPDLAKLLIKYGYAETWKHAFDNYLISAHNKTKAQVFKLSGKEIIELINNANGIPVLAHPIYLEMNDNDLEIYIKELISYGLKGIEVYHSDQDDNYRQMLLGLAHKYKLLISGGSDFHGIGVKPHVKIGTGINDNLDIKELTLVNYIKNR